MTSELIGDATQPSVDLFRQVERLKSRVRELEEQIALYRTTKQLNPGWYVKVFIDEWFLGSKVDTYGPFDTLTEAQSYLGDRLTDNADVWTTFTFEYIAPKQAIGLPIGLPGLQI